MKDESKVQLEKIGDDWVIETPDCSALILKNAPLAGRIEQMVRLAYWRGRRDVGKEIRELIGAQP